MGTIRFYVHGSQFEIHRQEYGLYVPRTGKAQYEVINPDRFIRNINKLSKDEAVEVMLALREKALYQVLEKEQRKYKQSRLPQEVKEKHAVRREHIKNTVGLAEKILEILEK